MLKERTFLGRIFAHLRHIELKSYIKQVRTNEGTLKEEPKTEEEQISELVRNMEQTRVNVNIDSEFGLPYGMGFDQMIKDKADLLKNNKFYNNLQMDLLV
jgi:hypothetical protein